MSSRSAKFVPALFATLVAGASLVAVTDLRAQATTDNCLSAPKGVTPAGGHWFYRIDRATKRQCWYLREENDEAAKTEPKDSAAAPLAAAANPAPQQPPVTITRKSIADARAEWLSQQARPEPNLAAKAEPRTTGAAPSVPAGKLPIGANVLAPTPLATTRWPDASGVNSPTDLRTAASDPAANQPQQAEEVQQPAAVPLAPPATEPATAKPTASLQMLLVVMAAALALAGLIVSMVVRIGRIRARRAMRRKRRAMWDSAPRTRRSPPSAQPNAEARQRRTEAVHNPRVREDRERQVTEALSRLARSARS